MKFRWSVRALALLIACSSVTNAQSSSFVEYEWYKLEPGLSGLSTFTGSGYLKLDLLNDAVIDANFQLQSDTFFGRSSSVTFDADAFAAPRRLYGPITVSSSGDYFSLPRDLTVSASSSIGLSHSLKLRTGGSSLNEVQGFGAVVLNQPRYYPFGVNLGGQWVESILSSDEKAEHSRKSFFYDNISFTIGILNIVDDVRDVFTGRAFLWESIRGRLTQEVFERAVDVDEVIFDFGKDLVISGRGGAQLIGAGLMLNGLQGAFDRAAAEHLDLANDPPRFDYTEVPEYDDTTIVVDTGLGDEFDRYLGEFLTASDQHSQTLSNQLTALELYLGATIDGATEAADAQRAAYMSFRDDEAASFVSLAEYLVGLDEFIGASGLGDGYDLTPLKEALSQLLTDAAASYGIELSTIQSAYTTGGFAVTTVVPIPPSVLMLGPCIVGVLSLSRRLAGSRAYAPRD